MRPEVLKGRSATTANPPPNLDEEIRRRAYELYEARGREDGRDLDDWLRAEAEITSTALGSAA